MQKIYIKARVRNVLFIRGAYRTARINNKKVILGAYGDARTIARLIMTGLEEPILLSDNWNKLFYKLPLSSYYIIF